MPLKLLFVLLFFVPTSLPASGGGHEAKSGAHGGGHGATDKEKEKEKEKDKEKDKDKESESKKKDDKPARKVARSKKLNWGNAQCLVEPNVLEDVRNVKIEMQAREKAVVTKEKELNKRESLLNEQLSQLEVARKELKKEHQAKRAQSGEKIAKLAESLLAMNPKTAAKQLEGMDLELAVLAMEQMDTTKLAKIMNLVEPNRARLMWESLGGVQGSQKSQKSMEEVAP